MYIARTIFRLGFERNALSLGQIRPPPPIPKDIATAIKVESESLSNLEAAEGYVRAMQQEFNKLESEGADVERLREAGGKINDAQNLYDKWKEYAGYIKSLIDDLYRGGPKASITYMPKPSKPPVIQKSTSAIPTTPIPGVRSVDVRSTISKAIPSSGGANGGGGRGVAVETAAGPASRGSIAPGWGNLLNVANLPASGGAPMSQFPWSEAPQSKAPEPELRPVAAGGGAPGPGNCPAGQFWNGSTCRGAVASMPGGIPTGGGPVSFGLGGYPVVNL